MKYFTIEELTKPDTATRRGTDSTPAGEVKKNLTTLTDGVLNPPILVNSGYRSVALNEAAGDSRTSGHIFGQPIDKSNLSWIHISYRSVAENRGKPPAQKS